MPSTKTESRLTEEDREFSEQKGIPENDRYGQDLLQISEIVLPGYSQKMIDLDLPRSEIVSNLKKELKLAGITESLSKHDIGKTLEKYKSAEPNREYLQKLRPPPSINYNEHPVDEAAPEEDNEDEVINEDEVNDPDYYPGMEESEPIDTTEAIPGPEPGQYPGDDLPDLPPLRSSQND